MRVHGVHKRGGDLGMVSFWEDIICRAHRGEGEFEAERSVSWGYSGNLFPLVYADILPLG